MTTQLMERNKATEICGFRAKAAELYAEAFDKLVEAEATARRAAGFTSDAINLCDDATRALGRGRRDDFLTAVLGDLDRAAWGYIIKSTNVERLMDKKAKGEFREELRNNPPPLNEDNIFATIEDLYINSNDIFLRGIANVFSSLDRRFRSHDAFKFQDRAVITRCFGDTGSWNHINNEQDTFNDIERVFRTIEEDEVPPTYAGIVGKIDEKRKELGVWEPHQYLAEDEYFRVRVFKNGNAHIWFKRKDLLAKVNKLLGEYYGEVIPDSKEPEDDADLYTPNTSLAKNLGWFRSPEAVVNRLLDQAGLYETSERNPPLNVLEPSAGDGAIALPIRKLGHKVTCIELHNGREHHLKSLGFNTWCIDFFEVLKNPIFDRVVMNPPFDRGRDIDHVMHALGMLKPGGRLVAVMGAAVEFSNTKKAKAFRALMDRMGAKFRDLPVGSFTESGTGVNAVILTVTKE